LVQETFCEAWRNVGQLQDRPRARAWLYRILRRRYWHWRRDSSRRVKVVQSQESASQNVAATAQPVLERMAAEDALQYALDSLDEQLRLPLLMVLMEGLTCKEAAEQLEIPLGTVLSRIHRARQLLQQVLQEHEIARVTTDGTPKHAKQ
jgi:RNA polymerase sigma-70 factor, ECF subfamily